MPVTTPLQVVKSELFRVLAHPIRIRILERCNALTPTIVFRLRNMTAIDATGLRALEDVTTRLRASGRTVILCGARDQPRAVMENAGFLESLGRENVCANIDAALARATDVSSVKIRGLKSERLIEESRVRNEDSFGQ